MLSNIPLVLIKSISAAYFCKVACKSEKHVNLMQTTLEELSSYIEMVEKENSKNKKADDYDLVVNLMYTLDWLIKDTGSISREAIVQRLNVNIHGNHYYMESILLAIPEKEVTPDEAVERADELMRELREMQKHNQFKKMISDLHRAVNMSVEHIDPSEYVKKILPELEGFTKSNIEVKDDGKSYLDFTNVKMVENAVVTATQLNSPDGCMKTGLTGLDMMYGGFGVKRGEEVNYGGLTHNYKSGMLMDHCLFVPMFNDPWMIDNNKTPMILRISFENTLAQDVTAMYRKLHEIKHQEKCDLAKVRFSEAAKHLVNHFGQRGYHFNLETYDANSFGIYDLFARVNDYEKKGFEIHQLVVDYLPLIAHHVIADRMDAKIQRAYEMVRQFCYGKGISLITACQLSTEAQQYAREAPAKDLTKKFSTGGYYMDCKSLHTKLDLEVLVHIVKHIDGHKYLSIHRGKHRGGEMTPESHLHCFYKFQKYGGIIPDYDNPELCLRNLPNVTDLDELNFD